MYNSYADVLESYMIAEEGFGDNIKRVGKKILENVLNAIKKLIEKIGSIINKIKAPKSTQNDASKSVSNNSSEEVKSNTVLRTHIVKGTNLLLTLSNTIQKTVTVSNDQEKYDEMKNKCLELMDGDEWHNINVKIDDLIDEGARVSIDDVKTCVSSLHGSSRTLTQLYELFEKDIKTNGDEYRTELYNLIGRGISRMDRFVSYVENSMIE